MPLISGRFYVHKFWRNEEVPDLRSSISHMADFQAVMKVCGVVATPFSNMSSAAIVPSFGSSERES